MGATRADETCVDGKGCVSVNPTMEAPAIKTTSVVGGVTGVVPKGGTLMVGNTLRFTLGSQLIIKAPAAGDKATSILLTKHTEGGAEVVFVPGSQKGDDKAGTVPFARAARPFKASSKRAPAQQAGCRRGRCVRVGEDGEEE